MEKTNRSSRFQTIGLQGLFKSTSIAILCENYLEWQSSTAIVVSHAVLRPFLLSNRNDLAFECPIILSRFFDFAVRHIASEDLNLRSSETGTAEHIVRV